MNLLEEYKAFNPKYDAYQYIEYYIDDTDTIVIPELKEEQPKQLVKKPKNNNKGNN